MRRITISPHSPPHRLARAAVFAFVLLVAMCGITAVASAVNCTCGDICVNQSGWWHDGGAINTSSVPIQDAVNNATTGDTVCVKDGTYYENVDVATRLTIRSENGSAVTTVNASNINDHVFEVTTSYVNITGFRVENAIGNSKAGIRLQGASYCNISYNDAIGNWHGIYLYNGCGHNNITHNNASESIQIGVLLHWVCSYNDVSNNTANSNNFHGFRIKEFGNYNVIKNNTAKNNINNGVYLFDTCNFNTVIGNTLMFNDEGIRIAKNIHDTVVSGNTLSNNTKGFHVIASHNNTLVCNWVSNNSGHGFYLTNVSPAVPGGLDSVDNNISYNNILTNVWQFNTSQASNIEAKNNYWGTTVSAEIAASIGENTGTVTYTPFLTWYSPCAPGYVTPPAGCRPPDPTTLANTTGNFWVNHTWQAGSGNVTDSYSVRVNSVWHNTSPAYYNDTYTAHAWQNITVYAFNSTGTGTLSSGSISQNTQILNNPITITNTSDWSGDEGANVYVDYDATDADSDTPTFSCNRTDLFTDFSTATGKGNWTAIAGAYYVDFGVSDGWGSTSNYTMTIAVSAPCTCGDICVNANGWWRDGGVLNASATPIKSAEANSIDGDIIFIYGGDYNESVTVLGNQNLSFVGEGRDIVNIKGTGALFDVRESNTNISGVNLSVASGQAGIRLYDVQNCYIDDIKSDGGAQGVRFYGSSNNSLKNSTANGSSVAGIELTFRASTGHNSTYNIIDNCTVTDCIATEGRGIYLMERCYFNEILNCSSTGNYRSNFCFGMNTANNTVRNCSFNGSIEYYGIRMYQSSYNTIDNCQICNNHRSGIFNSFSDWYRINNSVISNNLECGLSFTTGTNNTIESNYIENNTNYGIASYTSSSDNLIYNNRFDNTNNVYSGSSSFNIWNTTKQLGTNIIGGLYIGGNNWSDYAGSDTTGDGIGNTNTPYNNGITNGGDYLPLTTKGSIPFVCPENCDCFVVGGDSLTQYSDFNLTLQFIKNYKDQLDYVVWVGDMNYVTVNKENYSDIELPGIPSHWVVGNHEMDVGDERNISNLNTTFNNIVYYYNDSLNTSYIAEYNHSYVIVLDEYMEHPYGDIPVGSGLWNWLKSSIASLNHTKQIFAFGHEPAYPEHRHVGSCLDQFPSDRDALWSLFDNYSVEAYFCGHTHWYYKNSSMLNVTQIDIGNMRWEGGTGGDGNSTVVFVSACIGNSTAHAYSTSIVGSDFDLIETYNITNTYLVSEESTYLPPDPKNIQSTSGNFWVNHTWDAGTGNVTNSYNISVNSVWHNTSPAHYNDTYTAHAWQNITIYAYNTSGTGTLSAGNISQDAQIPNNPITITNTSGWSGNAGNNVYVDYDATDLDSDTPTFSCNRTDLFTDFDTANGTGNWTAVSGTYYVDFGVSDGYGSTDNYTMTITVSGAPPTYNCTCGDICVNTSGWWYNNSAFNASAVPIQDAVNNATAGETICVKDGTYNENVNVATRLTIRSENGSATTTVNASNPYDHVFEVTVNYVNISGFKVENATGSAGIYLTGASYCNISDNAASDNRDGIHLLSGSNNNNLTSNTANTNAYAGIFLSGSNNNDLTTNIANSNPGYGIVMDSSKNNTLSGCSAIGNGWGIVVMYSSNNNTISGCGALHSTYHGIYMVSSSNNTISGSTPKWNYQHGIYMSGSTNNNLTSNEVNANQQYGIYLSGSTNNNLTSNRIHSNWIHGIYLSGSNNNTIYNNRFQNYPNNAWDNGYNTWNTTPTPGQNIYGGSWLGGNHWTDYAGVDLSGDGLGDTLIPYNSSGNIVNGGDRHPLVQAAASYIPPDPTNIANTTGNFWVNHTWDAGTGNVTDSYNVSVNSGWHNTTTPAHYNDTYTAHAWQNITIYAYNTSGTGTLSSGNVSQDTQIPNNPVTITNTSDWSGDPGNNVYVDYDATDLDSDTPTFSCNRTDLFTDFDTTNGTGNWTAVSGTYYVDFGVSDSYGSTDNYTMTITVSGAPPTYNCTRGDICVNTSGWWYNNSAFNASVVPIQAAAGNATAGETIYVWNGSYTENVDVTTTHLTLQGEGRDVVTVTAAVVSDHVFEVTADYVNISGFNATGATGNAKAGIHLSSADYCNISSNNVPGNRNNIYLYSSHNNILTNNTIDVSMDSGIHLYTSTYNIITNNTANSNSANGISLVDTCNHNTITDNNLSHNQRGIYLASSSSHNNLTNNTANLNTVFGIYISASSNHNNFTNNTANSNSAQGIYVHASCNNNLTNNTANSNGDYGIHLHTANDNTFANNTLSDNSEWDIYIDRSTSAFTNNTLNGTTVSFTYGGNISLKGAGSPAADPNSKHNITKYINATNQTGTAWLFLNFSYSDSDVSGLDESSLAVWKHNGTAWSEEGTQHLDTAANVVGANITTFSVFAPMATAPSGHIPPDPTNIANTTGNFWVNHTWDAGTGNVTNSYNVSVNSVWHNTTTPAHYNDTYTAHAWQNITVYAYNTSDTGTLSSGNVSQDTQIPNNPITITNTSDWSGNPGANVYVDYDATDADSDTPTFSCNRTDLFTDFDTANGTGNWTAVAGTYYVDFGVSDGYGSTDNYTMTITVSGAPPTEYIPPDPTNIANTTGNFWVNHTWDAGTGNVTNSYNVSVNSVWHNTTTPAHYNDTYTAHAWQNITIYAYNTSGTGTLSSGNVSQDTQIPNNPITITNTSDWSGNPGANVYVDYDATDADSDTPTFSCNRTDLFTDFDTANGTGNWTAVAGTYYVDFGVSDGWGSTSNYTMRISQNAAPDKPTLVAPANGATGTSTNPTLRVTVTDPDGDLMNVTFYQQGGSQIGSTQTGIANGGTASVVWSGRSYSTTYYWYAVVNDGTAGTQSDIWHFRTQSSGGGGSTHTISITGCNDWSGNAGTTAAIDFGYWNADSDNPVFTTNATKGTLNAATGVWTWSTTAGDVGVYNWWFRVKNAYGNSDDCTVTVTVYTADTPLGLGSTTGNFWVDHTWNAVAGASEYRVRVNGVWHNGTDTHYLNTLMSPHGWSNITLASYNASTGVSSFITDDVQIPNNPITITNYSDQNVFVGDNVYVDLDYADLDGDTPTFSCSRTDLFTDFNTATGTGNWTTATNGTFEIDFGVTDGWGSVSNCTVKVRVGERPTLPTTIPISIWITITVLMFLFVGYTLHVRGYVQKIFGGMISVTMAYIQSQQIVSGNVVQITTLMNSADVMVTEKVEVVIPELAYLLLFVAAIMSLVTSVFIIKYIQFLYKKANAIKSKEEEL